MTKKLDPHWREDAINAPEEMMALLNETPSMSVDEMAEQFGEMQDMIKKHLEKHPNVSGLFIPCAVADAGDGDRAVGAATILHGSRAVLVSALGKVIGMDEMKPLFMAALSFGNFIPEITLRALYLAQYSKFTLEETIKRTEAELPNEVVLNIREQSKKIITKMILSDLIDKAVENDERAKNNRG